MKKIIYLITMVSALIYSGCTDFLTEEPKSSTSSEQYLHSASDAQSAVNQLYRSGFPTFYDAGSAYMGPTIMYGGYMSGLFDNQYKGQEEFVQHCQSLTINAVTDNDDILNIYQSCYEAISRANTAIKYIPGISELTESDANNLLAQAKFFRALNYFHLVKMFGGVPLITTPYESLDNLEVAKSTETAVYDTIISDLTFALDQGGLNDVPMPSNNFIISKGSVTALLADVYMNVSGYPLLSNKYSEAASLAKSLINNSAYALIKNGTTQEQSAYNTLRTSDSEKEYLYVIEYDASIADGGWRPTYCFPNTAATWGEFAYSICCNVYRPTATILAAYDTVNDLRGKEKQYFHKKYTYAVNGTYLGQTIVLDDVSPYIWFESDAIYNTAKSAKDQCHYRLAEMYLIAAEALAQTSGVTDEAAGYLATIKARASLNKTYTEIKSELLSLSKDDFIQEVWAERLRELVFENKTWNDITRTHKYPTTNTGGELVFVDFIGATNPWGKTFTEKNLLLPFPDDEIQRNPKLVQNTGY